MCNETLRKADKKLLKYIKIVRWYLESQIRFEIETSNKEDDGDDRTKLQFADGSKYYKL